MTKLFNTKMVLLDTDYIRIIKIDLRKYLTLTIQLIHINLKPGAIIKFGRQRFEVIDIGYGSIFQLKSLRKGIKRIDLRKLEVSVFTRATRPKYEIIKDFKQFYEQIETMYA